MKATPLLSDKYFVIERMDKMDIMEKFNKFYKENLEWIQIEIEGFIFVIDKIKENFEIKKINEDVESMSFNTAISSMMVFVNEIEKSEGISKKDYKLFLQILAPFAPHITEEIWTKIGEKKSIHISKWPKWDKKKVVDSLIKIVVQVNGKVRSEIMIGADMDEESVKSMALKDKGVIPWIEGKEVKRVIYVKGRLVNIVA